MSHAGRLRGFALFLVLLAAASVQARQSTPNYALIELGSLAGRGAIAQGLNNRGDVVGYSKLENGDLHAFLWHNGVMQDLGAPPLPRDFFSGAAAISDDGLVLVNDNEGGVFTWKDGTWSTLPFSAAYLRDVNKKNAITGSFNAHVGDGRAFLYHDGVLQDIGTLGGSIAHGAAVNDKLQVVGTASDSHGYFHAFLWDKGVMRDLGTLGGTYSRASDINGQGTIVGASADPSGREVSVISQGRGLWPLFDAPGSTHSAVAINDKGAVIGNIDETTYLFDRGVLTRLDTLPVFESAGWTRVFAMDINDRGWITGWGWRAGGSVDGQAFLLIPR